MLINLVLRCPTAILVLINLSNIRLQQCVQVCILMLIFHVRQLECQLERQQLTNVVSCHADLGIDRITRRQ